MRDVVDSQAIILRQAHRGQLTQGHLDALPSGLRAMVRAIQRRIQRQGNRNVRRFLKGNQHRVASVAGGGAQEVARRARQIANGSLQVSK